MSRGLSRWLVGSMALALSVTHLGATGCGEDERRSTVITLDDLSNPTGPRVLVTLDPFRIQIIDEAVPAQVLQTVVGGGADAYGAPGATRDDGRDATRILPGWDGYRPEERDWAHGASARVITKTDSSGSFELDAGSGKVTLDIAIDGSRVRLKMNAIAATTNPADVWNKTSIAFLLGENEHFFGLGERTASVDHRGISMYSWPEEGGTGKGEKAPVDVDNPFPNGPSMTYFPVPFFYSSKGYAIHLATTFRTETHFGSEQRKDAWRVAANTNSFEMVVYVHDRPLRSLDDFTRDTGRPLIPAPWVFGPRRRISNNDQVEGVLEWKKLRAAHVPTTGLDDNVHFLPARSELGREAELKAWTTEAHAWGYKVMAYNNPYVSISKPEAASDLAYGKEHDLFAKMPDGTTAETELISGEQQTLATIDLTKPEGVAWFQDLLRRTLALGYDGWMHDFGEYVRRPWVFADGRKGDEVHNAFPVLSAKAAFDLLSKERPNDFLFFVRSGYTGTQQYVPAVWGGDPEATFDETQGLPAMLRGGINLGLSGVPLWGSDVTGFKCITEFPNDKEMYLRWAEMGAVSPIMQEQNACANPISGRRTKWKLWNDQETIDVYAAMSRLHTRLMPYWQSLARDANQTGVPIMRHPFLMHWTEEEAYKTQFEFYLGPSLWAAPVVERGALTKDTWLPPGLWADVFPLGGLLAPANVPATRGVYEGGKHVTLAAPLGHLPLLIKDGGIVPLLDPTIETLGVATEPSVVSIDKVADRLDVIAAIGNVPEARIDLVDGTSLVIRRADAVTSTLPQVGPEDVAACVDGCLNTTAEPAIDRIRITTPLVSVFETQYAGIAVQMTSPTPRRVRWDVLVFRR